MYTCMAMERGTVRVRVCYMYLPKNTTQCHWPELKPRPPDPELSIVTMGAQCLLCLINEETPKPQVN